MTEKRGRGRPRKAEAVPEPKSAATVRARRAPRTSGGGGSSSVIEGSEELCKVIAQIDKQYGSGVATRGNSAIQPYRIPTSVFMLDYATLGGIPFNRISMFIGQRSSGKTTMSLKAAKGAQQFVENSVVALVDVEGTFDKTWAEKNGVDPARLVLVQPETGESAVDIAEALTRTKEVSLVIVDSLAALVPSKELNDSAEDQQVGLQARLIGKMIRKLTSALIAERRRGHYVTVLFINQYRVKIGGWAPHGGEPLSLPGGKAIEFSTSLQVVFKNKETMQKDDRGQDMLYMNEHAFQITKNKMHAGMRSGEFQIMRRQHAVYDIGESDSDDAETMLKFAQKYGMYTGGGRSWTLEVGDVHETFGNREEACIFLYENPDAMWTLRNHLIAEHARDLGMDDEYISRFID